MKLIVISLLALFLASGFANQSKQSDWTVEEIEELKNLIKEYYELPGNDDQAPGALRLSFHDCVGGCNGCINLNNAGNNGLSKIVGGLGDLYEANIPYGDDAKTMSRADFFNLGGISAVEHTIALNNDNCGNPDHCGTPEIFIDFVMGREDCATSPTTDDDVGLPAAHYDHSELLGFWANEFGFNGQEVVAIMGGHTLGGMDKDNSGYIGDWKVGEANYFNNKFYKFLSHDHFIWENFDAAAKKKSGDSNDRYMWQGTNPDEGQVKSFMINVDVDLVKDLEVIDEGGQSACEFYECNDSSTRQYAELYADNAEAWIHDFACAFEKMTQNGMSKLSRPLGEYQLKDGQIGCSTTINK